MPIYQCPQCGNQKAFSAYYSVPLDCDGEGVADADSFDITNAEIDSSSAMACNECGYSDTEKNFEAS